MTATLRLWHSGMLLILVTMFSSMVTQPTENLALPANFKIDYNSGTKEALCSTFNELYDEEGIQFKWKVNNVQLEEGLSTKNALDLTGRTEDLQMVECFASNMLGTSYALLNFVNGR